VILFISERGPDGEKPSAPVSSFAELLALSNVAYVQNHIQNFLRNTKGRDALIPMGLCTAIRTVSFISDVSDRPGAFSLFCCGPQVLDRSTAGSRESYDYTNSLVQMQLKTTDTTTGFSEKDIKTMTKLSFTAPRDFHELARLVENMAGITELLFGARSPFTDMLYEWGHSLTRAVGSTLATLRQLAHTDFTAACRLGWFIDRQMQQYLVLCAGVNHKEEINPSLLDFRAVRQQLEDGAFVFPTCDFLRDKLGRGAEQKPGAMTVTPSGSTSRTNRRTPPADKIINPQKDLFPKDQNDNWQVFLDHVRTGPMPNMCCRWHLNGKCRSSCFLRDSHVTLTTEQVASVKEWIKQYTSRMRRPSHNEGAGKKQKLGTSESAYSRSTFVAAPSKWSVPSAGTLAWFATRKSHSVGSPTHKCPSRQDDSPFNKRHTPADASPVQPHADQSTNVRRSTNDQQNPADAPPFRPYAATTAIVRWSPTYRLELDQANYAPTVSRNEPQTPGPERHMPVPGDESIRPTSGSTAVALHPPPARGRGAAVVPTRPTTSPTPATDDRADATSTNGKSHSHVPLPTIPLPFVDSLFPPLPEGRLADALASILDAPQPTTQPTAFRFEWSTAAADHNLAVLQKHTLDLETALAAQPFSSLTPGSEFRPAKLLAPFLSMHPLWPKFQERISNGAEFPLREIADADRIADVHANLARGNDKSAQSHEAKLIDMLKEEVERGWQLPLPKSAALMIKGCEVAPLGMVSQMTIDKKGNARSKLRLTHDQSFNPSRTEKRSVNDRVDARQ
jgi:hypothetical protein